MDGFTRVPAAEWMARYPQSADIVNALAEHIVMYGTRVVGITGAVAVGKSTFADAVAAALASRGVEVEQVSTDGFLRPNVELEAEGITHRKGFPESFDAAGLDRFLTQAKTSGPASVPLYSHVVYDVVDARPLRPHDVLLVEGVNVLQNEAGALGHLDLAVYLDADEWLLIEWFVDRFKRLREQALSDPGSFYHQFAAFSESEADSFARHIWRVINGPNLEAHILPSRENAHVVIAKRQRHGVDAVFLRSVG